MGAGGSFKPISKPMKITPNSDILIGGIHCPAGVAHETSEVTARSLVAQGLARFAPTAAAIETAKARPVIETATASPSRKRA
jgi:hypothetical protein